MNLLKVLNILAIFLIFTPFFQMCSGEVQELSSLKTELLSPSDSISNISSITSPTEPINSSPPSELSWWMDCWKLITMPGKNVTVTAFGLLTSSLVSIFTLEFESLWIGSLLIDASIVLTLLTLVKLFKRKTNQLSRLYAINVLILALTYLLVMVILDDIKQIKWGFYTYYICIILLLINSRTIPKQTT